MIDIPGAGEFHQQSSSASVPKMVEQMRGKFLKETAANETSVIVSISFGAMIAGQWMKQHPKDFSRAVLINSSFAGVTPFYHRLRPSALRHVLAVPFLAGEKKEARILELVSNHRPVCKITLESWTQIQRRRPVTVVNSLKQLMAAATCRVGDFQPQVPVLLLASTTDRMVDVESSRGLARKWKATLLEHPSAGHDLSSDDPGWVVEQIGKFLA